MNLLTRITLVLGHIATMLGDVLIVLATVAMFTVVARSSA